MFSVQSTTYLNCGGGGPEQVGPTVVHPHMRHPIATTPAETSETISDIWSGDNVPWHRPYALMQNRRTILLGNAS